MQPSDYRHNPFSDVSTAVLTTEMHKIPTVSPYTIQLNEVPVKTEPSTMRVQSAGVTASGVSIGADMVEVAASPSLNQYYPDYSTGADGDKAWNTGKVLFSSQNAGNLVRITYQAKGTLASVKANKFPTEWVDTGDGSDGDFWPTVNTTISGVKNFRSVIIPSNVTVTVAPWAKIKCQGVCWIHGTLSAYGTGGAGGARPGAGSMTGVIVPGKHGATGIVGGAGGTGGCPTGQDASSRGYGGGSYYEYPAVGNTNNNNQNLLYDASKLCVGAGGGSGSSLAAEGANSGGGGNGGGYIRIVAKAIQVTGLINASGSHGEQGRTRVGGGGGGGGGVVVLIAQELSHGNRVLTVGGNGGGSDGQASSGTAGGAGVFLAKEMGWS